METPNGFLDEQDHDDFQDLSFSNGAVVIPVSTHASSGPRLSSPTFGSSSNRSKGLQHHGQPQQQQQQRGSGSPVKSPARKGGYDALASAADDTFRQQRLSVEMSSIDGGSCHSTPSSAHNSSEATLGFRFNSPTAEVTAGVSVEGSTQQQVAERNYAGPSKDPTATSGQQQLGVAVAAVSSSPVRLKAVSPVARLGQQSKIAHYSD